MVLDIPELLQTTWTFDTADGTADYTMPANFVADKQVRYIVTANTDERELVYVTWDQYRGMQLEDDTASKGQPVYYTFWRTLGADTTTVEEKTAIFFSPTPDAVKQVKIRGYKVPSSIVAAGPDVLEIEAHFCEAMIFYACFLMMRDDGDDVRADRFKGDYREQIQKVKAFKSEESRNRIAMLTPYYPGSDGQLLPPQFRRVR